MTRFLNLMGAALLASATLVTAFATPAHAVKGMPMMYQLGAKTANLELAKLMQDSLEVDSSGNAMIKGSDCTTPNHFLDAINQWHPAKDGSVMTVAELPGFIKSLVAVEPTEKTFRMSRVMVSKQYVDGPATCSLQTDESPILRTFMLGELAWADGSEGSIILAGNCTNVVNSADALPPSAATHVKVSLAPKSRTVTNETAAKEAAEAMETAKVAAVAEDPGLSNGPGEPFHKFRVRFASYEKMEPGLRSEFDAYVKARHVPEEFWDKHAVSLRDDTNRWLDTEPSGTICSSAMDDTCYPMRSLGRVMMSFEGKPWVYWRENFPREVALKKGSYFQIIPGNLEGYSTVWPPEGQSYKTTSGDVARFARAGLDSTNLTVVYKKDSTKIVGRDNPDGEAAKAAETDEAVETASVADGDKSECTFVHNMLNLAGCGSNK